ncbi:MAG TPA: glycosyltransferase family 39 protein [Gemmatimonadota bacterium]|nr:glycosyltransferase family 39 protein [Gemmatimonadota bacterium]
MSPGEWALGVAIFGGAAWLLALLLPARAAARLREGAGAFAVGGDRRRTVTLLLVLGGILVFVSTFAFEHRPQLIDDVIQVFQAKIFASGALMAPEPADRAFFITQHMIMDGGRWYSQYPPGHSALLALGVLSGAAWLVPIALSVATAALLYRFVAEAYDESTARLTLLLLVLAPFFWFMGASFMNHVSSLAGVAAFLYGFARWEKWGSERWLALAGAALGVAILSRPVEIVAIGAVFGGVLAVEALRRKSWRPIAACGIPFLAVASLYLAFNAATTGHPLRPGYIELWGSAHGLGFHEGPWGEPHTPAAGLRNEILDLALLNVFLFEWPVPALWPLGIALAAGWLSERWDARLLTAFLAVPAVYFFYWHRDTFLGPRFLYVTIAFLVPLLARAAIEGARRLRARVVPGPGSSSVDLPTWAVLALVLATGYAVAYGIPARYLIYRTSMESMKLDLVAEAKAAGIDRGLVFVAETWGSRVIAELRGLGASAPAVEKAYRQADLCELQEIVDRARTENWSPARVEAALDEASVGADALVFVDVGGGPTTRFKPGSRLTAACLDEVRYDRLGYTLFTPHLADDPPDLDGPLVIARDLRDRNAELVARYPERGVWIYRGGELRPWRP